MFFWVFLQLRYKTMKNILTILICIIFINSCLACEDTIPISVIKTDEWKHKRSGEEYPIEYEIVIPIIYKSWEFQSFVMGIGKSSFPLRHEVYEKDTSKVVVYFSATSERIKEYKFEAMYLPYKKYYKERNLGIPLCFYAQKIEFL